MKLEPTAPVAVIGAGIMGAGIAQVMAQAGHRVGLFDVREGAAQAARDKLADTLGRLVEKGKFTPESADATLARIEVATALKGVADARLVVEAIVEQRDAKRELLHSLEELVAEDCILASNTSSISVTALANGMRCPGRIVGMHFFNPAPVMKLVEVVSGLQTEPIVAQAVHAAALRWGKAPVHAKSTPGFIVNRIARPFYAEALALLQEHAAQPEQIDACLRGTGFRMGPCELMDLIGHDTNLAVTESVYHANFGDKRFVPSLVQRQLVDAGLLGRKSGRGFYVYPRPDTASVDSAVIEERGLPTAELLVLHGQGGIVQRWAACLTAAGREYECAVDSDWRGLAVDGAELRVTDGRPALQIAAKTGVRDLVVCDVTVLLNPDAEAGTALAWSAAACASQKWNAEVPQWLAVAGLAPRQIDDAAGLVVARTVAMLINEAADAVQQGVCDQAAADTAMRRGVNYPAGPFEWLARWPAGELVRLLGHLDDHYRGERYRVSPWLRQRGWAGQLAT